MRWLPVAVAMLASGAVAGVLSTIVLFGLGVVLFGNHDAFSRDGVGWAASVGGIVSATLPPLGLLAPLVWSSRRRLGVAAAWSLALALGLGGIGIGLRSLVPDAPAPRPRHRILWTGSATAMPATIGLAEGVGCYLFAASDDGGAPHDPETVSVGVRDPAGTPVSIRRSDGGLVTYPSPDDPGKRVAFLGSFTAAVPGSYAITVDGSSRVYATDIPPAWRHEHPLAGIAAELPRYAAVLALAGLLLLALALRQAHRAA
jgi:hypothetical protein